jgi:hypothetical protein
VLKVQQVQLVLKVQLVQRVLKVLKDNLVLMRDKVPKELQVPKEL